MQNNKKQKLLPHPDRGAGFFVIDQIDSEIKGKIARYERHDPYTRSKAGLREKPQKTNQRFVNTTKKAYTRAHAINETLLYLLPSDTVTRRKLLYLLKKT